MGISGENKQNKKCSEHKSIGVDIIIKVRNAICKIILKKGEEITYGTGFFMKVSDSKKYLVTNYHNINPEIIYDNIEIEIWNKKILKLFINNREIKYFKPPKDITIIEIKKSDEIFNYIKFLNYDINFLNGYHIYKNADIFSIEYPFGKEALCASGSIIDIKNFEFDHNISTDCGSSGSPILLLNNNINLIQVIGIHKNADKLNKVNGGTFIGEIINAIDNGINKSYNDNIEKNNNSKNINKFKNNNFGDNNMNNTNYNDNNKLNKKNKKIKINEIKNPNNYIISELYIKDKDINSDIRIINSYEEFMRSYFPDLKINQDFFNEEEINENIIIKINDKLIPFYYFHQFNKKGKYIIKYLFNNNLCKINYIFSRCDSLTSIDLSHFNTENIIHMNSLFSGCKSLTNIDLSNFDTKNVKNFSNLFQGCESLKSLNLSNFNTQNVINMNAMLAGCSSLTSLDLSNFNTQNVINMNALFDECSNLSFLNLSNFHSQNVTDMGFMFSGCSSLVNIDLSNFNTQKVTNMSYMFSGCSSLMHIDLSNFNTQNVINICGMFDGDSSLKEINLSNFNTQNVINMSYLFNDCSSLTNIDISNFNVQDSSKIVDINFMFENCSSLNLKNVIVDDIKILVELYKSLKVI